MIDTNSKPDAVNEKGIKFWLDRSLTDYAKRKGVTDIQVLLAMFPNGHTEWVIVRENCPIFASQVLETVACHIDAMAFYEAGS